MTIGVDAFRTREDLLLDRLLLQPFRESPGGYTINRRPEPQRDIRDGRDARRA